MTDDNKSRLQKLFLELTEIEPSQRETWFRQNEVESGVRDELLELLQFHDKTRLPIDDGVFSIVPDTKSKDFALQDDKFSPSLEIVGYELNNEVARGGQSVVYDAIQLSTSQRVAVKVLITAEVSSEQERARQDREVQILASLQHPHVVGVIDRGKTSSGVDYVVMPFIEGRSLDEYVLYMEQEGASSTDSNVLKLFIKIARAVGFAHEKGIIHRDLKPANILVDRHGEPRILDFGLAKIFDSIGRSHEPERCSSLTIDGAFMGSLPWASPEQAGGELNKISPQTDVYALGVVLYQMLTGGAFPYTVVGNIMEVLDNILHSDPVPPSKRGSQKQENAKQYRHHEDNAPRKQLLNPAMDAIVLKALDKETGSRYANGNEFADDIERYLEGRQTVAPVQPESQSSTDWFSYPKFAHFLFATAFALVAVFATIAFLSSRYGNNPENSAATPTVPAQSHPKIYDGESQVGFAAKANSSSIPEPTDLKFVLPPKTESLSPLALVSSPRKIEGVTSWTLELDLPRIQKYTELHFSDDNKTLISAAWDGMIRIYDKNTGELRRVLIGHADTHFDYECKTSSDGQLLTTRSGVNRERIIWEVLKGYRLLATDQGGEAAFVPGTHLLAIPRNNIVETFDPETAKLDVAFRSDDPTDDFQSVAFSKDGKTAVCANQGTKDLVVWNVQSASIITRLSGHQSAAYTVSITPDSSHVIAEGYNCPVHVWPLKSPEKMWKLSIDGTPIITGCAVGVTEEPLRVYVESGKHGKIFGWNLESREVDLEIESMTSHMSTSPDSKFISGGLKGENAIGIVDLQSKDVLWHKPFLIPTFGPGVLNHSTEGIYLAIGSKDGILRWQLDSSTDGPKEFSCELGSGLKTMELTPDRRYFVAVTNDMKLVRGKLDGDDLELITTLADASSYYISKDAAQICIANSAGISLLRPQQGKLQVAISNLTDVSCMTMTSDARTLLVANGNGDIHLLDLNSRNHRSIAHDGAKVIDMAMSPDEEVLAAIDSDGLVRIVNTQTLEPIASYKQEKTHADHWGAYMRRVDLHWSKNSSQLTSIRQTSAVLFNRNPMKIENTKIGEIHRSVFDHSRLFLGGSVALSSCHFFSRLWQPSNGRTLLTFIHFENGDWLIVSPDGHYRCSTGLEDHLVYVVVTKEGQQTLRPDEFGAQYNWKNDPAKARILLSD
ncbi:MAG: serine/threonine-protein kinase [Planctomycetota bacterium]